MEKRKSCIGCHWLSGISGLGKRYCNNSKRKDSKGIIDNVNIIPWFCPINNMLEELREEKSETFT